MPVQGCILPCKKNGAAFIACLRNSITTLAAIWKRYPKPTIKSILFNVQNSCIFIITNTKLLLVIVAEQAAYLMAGCNGLVEANE